MKSFSMRSVFPLKSLGGSFLHLTLLLFVMFLGRPTAFAQSLLNRTFEPPFNPLYLLPTVAGASISGSIANGWTDNSAWADVTLAYSQENDSVHGGSAAQRIDIQRVGTGGAMQFVQPINLIAGKIINSALWMRAASPVSVDLILRQAFGSTTIYASNTVSLSTQWQRYSVSTTPPNTEAGYFMVRARTSGTVWLDDASIDSSFASCPPLVDITSPANGASFSAGSPVTITASASDSDGTISKVDFYRNGVFIASATTPPYSVTWSNPGNNIYPLTAVATDNSGATGTSCAVKIAVGSAPALRLSVTDPDASKYGPDPGKFTVTRSTNSGALDVRFTVGGTAVSGSDYVALSGTVTIPDSQSSADISVLPISSGTTPDSTVKTVILTLASGSNYLVDVSANTGTVNINPSYAGREAGAAWRSAAATRIDQYRKGNLMLVVQDQLGNPLPAANVHVQMTRHAFGFGVAVDAAWINASTSDAQTYQATVLQNFNRIVFANDLKWPQWEANPQTAINALSWARARGLDVRGHNLIWPSWNLMPSNVQPAYNTLLSGSGQAVASAFLHNRILDHIASEVGALAGQCVEWDVLNEPYAHHDVQDILGQSEMAAWYNAARSADGAPKLFINDYDIVEASGTDIIHQNSYYNTIQTILSQGGPLDGIGFQSHFSLPLTSPDAATSILDRFAGLEKISEVTEFDVNTTDEEIQADYLRDYLTLVFSRPEFNAFVIWGYWQATLNKPNTALFRYDWSPKPCATAYHDLVFNQWWTDTRGTSNASGGFSTRGFCGNYQITVSSGTCSQVVSTKLSTTGTTLAITLQTPPFEAWQRQHFGSDSASASDSSDPDHDGIPNLEEYAFHLDPATPSSLPLVTGIDPTRHLTLTFPKLKSATDITYTVEVSSDLVTWNSGPDWVDQAVTEDDATMQTITATDKTQSPSTASRRFIRLRISRP